MIEKTISAESAISSLTPVTETVSGDLSPEIVPLNTTETGGETRIGELNYYASSVKSVLNDKLPTQVKASPDAPENPNLYETLKQIEDLPKPNRKGIPSFFTPNVREEIYQKRVRAYNNRRAQIAEYALGFAQPPTLKNFGADNLPPQLKRLEYRDALNAYNRNLTELNEIYRDARQDNLALHPQYQKLPAETKQLLGEKLEQQTANFDFDLLISLAKTRGFNQLDSAEQERFLNYVGGTNTEISQPARSLLFSFFNDPTADKTDPETFRQFLIDQPHLDPVFQLPGLTAPTDSYNPTRRSYEISGPQDAPDYDFHSGKADALKYEVEIDGRTFPVYLPKNPDPAQFYQTIDEVAKGLAGLPQESFDAARSVRVDPERSPDDPFFAKLYNIPDFRASASAGADGDINIYPSDSRRDQSALDGTLIHESGHIISGQKFVEIDSKTLENLQRIFIGLRGLEAWDDWKEAMNSDVISPSEYATKSPKEDFSETLVLYLKYEGTPQEAEFRALMPERFALLDEVLGK